MGLRLDLISLTVFSIGDVLIPLNCYKVSTDNIYKALQVKCKMTQILRIVMVDR
jgi:hypothetical protein